MKRCGHIKSTGLQQHGQPCRTTLKKNNHSRQKFLSGIKWSNSVEFNITQHQLVLSSGELGFMSPSCNPYHLCSGTKHTPPEDDNSLAYKPLLRLKSSFLFPVPVKFPVPQKIPHVDLPITYTGIISRQEQYSHLYSISTKELLQMLGAHVFKFQLLRKDRFFHKDILRDKRLTYTNSKHTDGLISCLHPQDCKGLEREHKHP